MTAISCILGTFYIHPILLYIYNRRSKYRQTPPWLGRGNIDSYVNNVVVSLKIPVELKSLLFPDDTA